MTPSAQTSIALVIGGLVLGMYRFGLLLGIELRLSSSGGGTRFGFGFDALMPEGPAPGVASSRGVWTAAAISESDVTLVVGVPEAVPIAEDLLAPTLVPDVEIEGAPPLVLPSEALLLLLAGVVTNSSPV